MKVLLVTPAARGARNGNRVTALRWASMLRRLGHRVRVSTGDDGADADLLVAIHAWRSAAAVSAFRARLPGAPVVLLLSGTDIYRFQHEAPEVTLATMHTADALVGLHDTVGEDIPAEFGSKLHIIHQSFPPSTRERRPVKREFRVLVVGHLREEKDPLRAALAARLVPARSRLRVIHLGAAHTTDWAKRAEAEAADNPRYRWLGSVTRSEVRRYYANSHALVMSSRMEGGANVVSEAIVAGLPVIASDISGNRGLLGKDHAALFPPGDERALAALLHRAEHEPAWLDELAARGAVDAGRFDPALESARWEALLAPYAAGA